MNRREFVKLGAGMVAGVAAAGLSPAQAAAVSPATSRESGYVIGCYTRAFDQFDYRVGLDAIAEAGFRYLGLMTTNTKDWVMVRPATPPEEVEALASEARKRGLAIQSVYADFSAADPAEAAANSLRNLVDHAARCASPYLLLGGAGDEKLVDRYYGTIKELCPYAAGKGVTITIKPHGGPNATGPQCRKIIERVGHPAFRLWYDPGNIFYYSDGRLDPKDDAATVNGLVAGMSVKDFKPPKEVLVNPGQGKVDFPAVMARLREGGFKQGPLLVECLERGSLEQVKAAAAEARRFLEKLTASW